MGVVGLAIPLMRIFGTIIDQQQDARRGQGIHKQVEQGLRLRINPVKVLEDDDQRLVEALARQYPFDHFQGAPPS